MFNNFIPTVWNEGIMRELERICVFAEDCNREYEGDVKNAGDSVRILGIGKPTITKYERKDGNVVLSEPEVVEDSSVTLYINQIATFHYKIDDIDKAQSVKGLDGVLDKETSEALSNEVDKYIAALAVTDGVAPLYDTPQKIVGTENAASGEKYVLDAIDEAIEKLQENDVGGNCEIVITVSPKFYRLFKKAYRNENTNNSATLKNGKVARYGNVTVKLSNNVYRKDGVDNIMLRTKKAIAYVNPKTHSEAYRPEKSFSDALKGYMLFDAKVVRPKEIINLNVKYV